MPAAQALQINDLVTGRARHARKNRRPKCLPSTQCRCIAVTVWPPSCAPQNASTSNRCCPHVRDGVQPCFRTIGSKQVTRMKMSAEELGEHLRQRVVERYRRLPPLQELRIAPEPPRSTIIPRRSRLVLKTRPVQKPRPVQKAAKPPSVAPPPPVQASAARKKHPNRISHDFLFRRHR